MGVNKKAVVHCKVWRERLFFNISSLLTPSLGGKKHWLLVIEDSTDFSRIYFLKEKLELKNVMMLLMKDIKAMYGINVK